MAEQYQVVKMFEDMKAQLNDWADEDEVKDYLSRLLDKQAFDKKGLIYGMGHAVYSISDPRAEIFKVFVEKLAKEKGYEKEYALYELVERLGPQVIGEKRKDIQRSQCQCRLLQRPGIQYAGTDPRLLHGRSWRRRVWSVGVHTVWKS